MRIRFLREWTLVVEILPSGRAWLLQIARSQVLEKRITALRHHDLVISQPLGMSNRRGRILIVTLVQEALPALSHVLLW